MKMAIRKNIHNLSQGPPNPGFMQKKVQKRGFSKKAIARIEKLFLFQIPMNLLKAWNAKFYAGKSTKRGFSKKALARMEKLFLFSAPMNPSNTWKGKLEADSFFAI